jgi:hypothetical protein
MRYQLGQTGKEGGQGGNKTGVPGACNLHAVDAWWPCSVPCGVDLLDQHMVSNEMHAEGGWWQRECVQPKGLSREMPKGAGW